MGHAIERISERRGGGAPRPYVVTRTGWDGEVPDGLGRIEVRSRYVQFVPHIAVLGEGDLDNVHALQQGLRLVRLADCGTPDAVLKPGPPMRPIRRLRTSTNAGPLTRALRLVSISTTAMIGSGLSAIPTASGSDPSMALPTAPSSAA
jgi:hypothetical protein